MGHRVIEAVVARSDNRPMRSRGRARVAAAAAMALVVAVAGCGWAEWPPPRWRTQAPPPASPGTPTATPAPEPARVGESDAVFVGADKVKVGPGDTVYALSRRHRVSTRGIIDANGLSPPYHLRVGQIITLPRDRIHQVAPGETLNSVSRRYGVDTYVLARTNDLAPPYLIRVGQRLRIPYTGPADTAQQTAALPSSVATAPLPAPGKPAPSARPVEPAPLKVSRPSVPQPIARPPVASPNGFIWPVEGRVVSAYGTKSKGLRNDGINIVAARGTPVRAAQNGVVAYAGNELRGFGNLLLIKHADGWVTAYAHNETLLVQRGDTVRQGQVVARVGSTGNVAAPQLHFEVRKGKSAVDPKRHLPPKDT